MNLIMAGRTSLLAQMVKRLPTMRETQVQSLGQEDPLEKDMAPHSSTLAWKIPWMEEPGRLQSMGSQRVGHDWVTSFHFTSMAGKEDNWVYVCVHTHTHTHTETHTQKQKWKPCNFPGEFIAGADHVPSSDLQCVFRRDGKIWCQLKKIPSSFGWYLKFHLYCLFPWCEFVMKAMSARKKRMKNWGIKKQA